MIRFMGRTERRVVTALLVTGILPLLAATWLADRIITNIALTAFHPEFEVHLERSLGLYKDLVESMKHGMRSEAVAIGTREPLRDAARRADAAAVTRELGAALAAHPSLLSLRVDTEEGDALAERKRDRPLDQARERAFTVVEPLGQLEGEPSGGPNMVAIFAADNTRMTEMDEAQAFAQMYRSLATRKRSDLIDLPHLASFAALLGLTVVLAVFSGVMVVRPLIRRIHLLAAATRPVAAGDLSVRVEDRGRDEIADLASAFNLMLGELDQSRARVEFLKRVGEWQQMARRLAHEIKNPLTPIQLAVEECHRRYTGQEEGYKELLSTTRDIVVEEVASLRRLVGEFAAFARLPRSDLREAELREYLLEQKQRLESETASAGAEVTLELAVDDKPMPVALDRTMLYRVLSNLVANAAQATAAAHPQGRVILSASTENEQCVIDVDDDGPGIPPALRRAIFDPYVTTKKDGTGLGLTIAKKVVIDHGGHIDVEESPLGGARFRIRLPLWGTHASEAALSRSELHPVSG